MHFIWYLHVERLLGLKIKEINHKGKYLKIFVCQKTYYASNQPSEKMFATNVIEGYYPSCIKKSHKLINSKAPLKNE